MLPLWISALSCLLLLRLAWSFRLRRLEARAARLGGERSECERRAGGPMPQSAGGAVAWLEAGRTLGLAQRRHEGAVASALSVAAAEEALGKLLGRLWSLRRSPAAAFMAGASLCGESALAWLHREEIRSAALAAAEHCKNFLA